MCVGGNWEKPGIEIFGERAKGDCDVHGRGLNG